MSATSHGAQVPSPGFTDPVADAQRAFRAILEALAHPTRRFPLAGPPTPPDGLGSALAAVALSLLDESTGVWLSGGLGRDADLTSWLTFHTGAQQPPEITGADFIFCDPASRPRLDALAQGSDEAPHLSATVVLDVRGWTGDSVLWAHGPGIETRARLDAPWIDATLLEEWQANERRFPRGVDLLVVDATSILGLPRSTHLSPVQERP